LLAANGSCGISWQRLSGSLTLAAAAMQFDEARADRAVRFFERVLVHTKGRWARRPFLLADWQRDDIIRPLFGSVRFDDQFDEWVRAYRIAWIELGRGNGKSEVLAGIALYLLTADDEESAEIYGAARDRDQATLVFNVAKRMVELSPTLRRRLTVVESRRRIVDPRTNSTYQVIASDAAGNLGQGPHGVIFDEIISQPNRDLWDALKSGLGKRTQPLMVAATTAGNDLAGFAKGEHDYCERISADPSLDPSRLVYLRNTPADADPWDESNWYFANPGLGDFLSLETLRAEAREARNDPTNENAFRQFRLNQWVAQQTRWLQLEVWDRSAGMVVESDLIGEPCFGGLDLAATSDLAALAWVFPPELRQGDEIRTEGDGAQFDVVWRFWTTEATVAAMDKATGGQFGQWCRYGLIEVCAGDAIDYSMIHRRIFADAARFDVREIGLDRWNSQATYNELDAAGIDATALAQGYRLSPALREIERLVKGEMLQHGGNGVARWNVGAAEVKRDTDDRIKLVKPDRGATSVRVDGVAALAMALDRWSASRAVDDTGGFGFWTLDEVEA